jgi:hypothetical protein
LSRRRRDAADTHTSTTQLFFDVCAMKPPSRSPLRRRAPTVARRRTVGQGQREVGDGGPKSTPWGQRADESRGAAAPGWRPGHPGRFGIRSGGRAGPSQRPDPRARSRPAPRRRRPRPPVDPDRRVPTPPLSAWRRPCPAGSQRDRLPARRSRCERR